MAKVCISGYYGYDSIGNELVLMSMVNALRHQSENMEIVVFSGNPAKTREDFDVTAVDRDDWNMVKNELKTADLLISGGGHLLREDANMDVLKYYLKVIKTALRYKKPVFVFNQVIGPLTSSRAKNMVSKVMQKVHKITVADKDSADLLHSMGIRRGRIHLMEDPVLAMKDFESEWNLTNIVQPEEKPVVKPFEKKNAEPAPINYDGMEVEIEIRIVEPEAQPEDAADDGAEVTGDTIEIVSLSEGEADEVLAEAEKSGENVVEVPAGIVAETAPSAAEETVAAEPEGETAEDAVVVNTENASVIPEENVAKPAKKVWNRPHNLGLVVPSFWKKPGEKFVAFTVSARTDLPVTQITAMADYMIDQGYQVVFLPVNYPDDVLLAKEIITMMKNDAYEVDAKMSPQSLLTAICEVDFVFSSEIYPMMLAAVCKKPLASLCASGRAIDFVTGLGLTPTGSLLAYDGEAFIRNFKAAVANPEVIVSAIETNLPDLQEKAEYGMSLLQILFEQIQRKKARGERRKGDRSQERQLERRSAQARNIVGGNEAETLPPDDASAAATSDEPEIIADDRVEAAVDGKSTDETDKEA